MRPATAALLACTLAVASCGDSDDTAPPDCDGAEQIAEDAVTEYCDGETNYCCYCACWDDFAGNFDDGLLYSGGGCECVYPAGTASPACEGEVAEEAAACLEDEDSCAEVATTVAEALCEDSVLPQEGE